MFAKVPYFQTSSKSEMPASQCSALNCQQWGTARDDIHGDVSNENKYSTYLYSSKETSLLRMASHGGNPEKTSLPLVHITSLKPCFVATRHVWARTLRERAQGDHPLPGSWPGWWKRDPPVSSMDRRPVGGSKAMRRGALE